MGPISLNDLGNILEDFDQSDLPFKVDVHSWDSFSDDFKKLIEQDLRPIDDLKVE